ncbi:hypothetical protein [Mycobacterium sp. E2327]|uniref:hypothetical protein n=1 Tax=Mycobacterium sp. E2327 TaxID=1834132 RepID=UPI000A742861|nr:hypothetical protein [Mycobacterium sp. E2327]
MRDATWSSTYTRRRSCHTYDDNNDNLQYVAENGADIGEARSAVTVVTDVAYTPCLSGFSALNTGVSSARMWGGDETLGGSPYGSNPVAPAPDTEPTNGDF